ncbi:unnamed protein product [Parajaminaea phylloscopi]
MQRPPTSALLLFAPALCWASPATADSVKLAPDAISAYVPSLPGNATVAAFYGLFSAVMFWHVFRTRSWWGLCEPIGAFFSFLGFILRCVQRNNQASQGLYIAMYLFVVLSPACFLAFNYIVYGRLLTAVTGIDRSQTGKAARRVKSPYSPVPPRSYTAIFVVSDVVTFLIQAAGGGMQTSKSPIRLTGDKVFLAGVVLQLASYVFFTVLMVWAHIKLVRDEPEVYSLRPSNILRQPPLTVLFGLYLSSLFIIIRQIYRSIEMAQGYGGTLFTTEIYTMLLDAMPLLIAIGIWAVVWPKGLLDKTHPTDGVLRRMDGQAAEGGAPTTGQASPVDVEKEGP